MSLVLLCCLCDYCLYTGNLEIHNLYFLFLKANVFNAFVVI